MKALIVLQLLFSSVLLASGQNKNPASCYKKTSLPDDHIFQKMETYPSFNGGYDKLNQFLLGNIDIDKISESVTKSTRYFFDTLNVRFVVMKDGSMTRLEVTGTSNSVLHNEIAGAIKKSSCSWIPGYSGGRNLNGWYYNMLIFYLDRRGSFFSVKIEQAGKPYF